MVFPVGSVKRAPACRSLPPELVQEIFSHLSPPEVRRAGQVSKPWRSVAQWSLARASPMMALQPPAVVPASHAQATVERLARHYAKGIHGPRSVATLPVADSLLALSPKLEVRPNGVYLRKPGASVRIVLPKLWDVGGIPRCVPTGDVSDSACAPYDTQHGALSFSPDALILTKSGGATLRRKVPRIYHASLSHDGSRLATSHENSVRVWGLPKLDLKRSCTIPESVLEPSAIGEVLWSYDDARLAGMNRKFIYVWNSLSGRIDFVHQHSVGTAMAFSDTGQLVSICPSWLSVLDPSGMVVRYTEYPIAAAVLSAAGETAFCARPFREGYRKKPQAPTTTTFEIDSGLSVGTPFSHHARAVSLALSWDRRWLLALCSDATVEVWDLLQASRPPARIFPMAQGWRRGLRELWTQRRSYNAEKAREAAEKIWAKMQLSLKSAYVLYGDLDGLDDAAQDVADHLRRYYPQGGEATVRQLCAPMRGAAGTNYYAGNLYGAMLTATLAVADFYAQELHNVRRSTALIREMTQVLGELPLFAHFRGIIGRSIGSVQEDKLPNSYWAAVRCALAALGQLPSQDGPLREFQSGISFAYIARYTIRTQR